MKISLALIGSASVTALAGIAVAQATRVAWPQIEMADLEHCRPVIAQVHKLEESYVRDVTARECNAPARYYSTESCRTARRWLAKTQSQDDVVWFFEGNDRCQGTDYPCFGVRIYNTVRTGDEARRWTKYFLDKSARPFSVTRGMDLWTAAREADTCVSGLWAAKYRDMAAPPAPPPVEVAEAAPPPAPPVEPAAAAVAALETVAAPTATATTTASAITTATIANAATTTDAMKQITTLIAEGKTAEAITLADTIAATMTTTEAALTTCKTRVLARQDLDRALIACYSTGKANDPAVLETRGELHLLAGRHQDAWNDFNAAFAAKETNATLYLRGLAAAGMGRTADALKDLATAEAGEKGIMAAFEGRGYSLAAVMSGKPLVEAAPAAPAAPVEAAAVPVAAPAAAAVEEAIVPLPNAVYPPADAPEVAVPVAVAVAPAVEVAVPEPAAFAASTGAAVAVPGISQPAVTDCIAPVAPGKSGRGAFKNKCSYPVRFTYCNIKPARDADQLTCGSDTRFRAETIDGNGSQPAILGQSVAYFACRSPTLPEVIYTTNSGLEGYCR